MIWRSRLIRYIILLIAYENNDFNMEKSGKIYMNAPKVISYIKTLVLIYD